MSLGKSITSQPDIIITVSAELPAEANLNATKAGNDDRTTPPFAFLTFHPFNTSMRTTKDFYCLKRSRDGFPSLFSLLAPTMQDQ